MSMYLKDYSYVLFAKISCKSNRTRFKFFAGVLPTSRQNEVLHKMCSSASLMSRGMIQCIIPLIHLSCHAILPGFHIQTKG